jgi:hypothetical protein
MIAAKAFFSSKIKLMIKINMTNIKNKILLMIKIFTILQRGNLNKLYLILKILPPKQKLYGHKVD